MFSVKRKCWYICLIYSIRKKFRVFYSCIVKILTNGQYSTVSHNFTINLQWFGSIDLRHVVNWNVCHVQAICLLALLFIEWMGLNVLKLIPLRIQHSKSARPFYFHTKKWLKSAFAYTLNKLNYSSLSLSSLWLFISYRFCPMPVIPAWVMSYDS